ncbi:RNA polymerase sigma factor [Adlercreutzia muris]|uniref:RNA polymerase sigma factor n=1 Tax=Adlercreutzia muris TaxID=1796610 RepID=UPI003B968429
MDAFGRDVYRFAFSQVAETQAAEDIYQEVFEAFFRSDTAFESAAHLKHWLLKTASNRCKRYFRRRSQNREVPFDPTADYHSRLAVHETNRSSEFHDVWDFVDALPPEQREPIYLYYVEGYSTREIAAITEVAHSTVRTRLRRARLALRTTLSKGEPR